MKHKGQAPFQKPAP